MTAPRETEIKLEADGGVTDDLRQRLTAVYGAPDATRQLDSVYFDTSKQALRKAGITLRVRSDGTKRVQTVKRDIAGGTAVFRDEWERPIAGDEPDPAALADTPVPDVLQHSGTDNLAPLFGTSVKRTVWTVRQADGDVEIALDVGEVRASGRSLPLAEIECELKRGGAMALATPLRRMSGWDGLRVGVLSKAERGFLLSSGKASKPVKAEPVRLQRGMTAAAAVQAILRSCLRQFRLNEPLLVATRSPESLHQARVGLRRLRSALSLFAPLLSDDAYPGLKERLRDASRALGHARDLDVYLHEAVEPKVKREPDQVGAAEILDSVKARREAALDEVLQLLDARPFRRLMLEFVTWVETGDWLVSDDRLAVAQREQSIENFAADLLETRLRQVKKKGRHLARQPADERHRLRIAAKKLRYAAEFTETLAASRRERARHKAFVDVMEGLQTVLGNLNDIEAGRHIASDLASGADGPVTSPATAFSAGRLAGEADARIGPLLEAAKLHYDDVIDADRFWSRW